DHNGTSAGAVRLEARRLRIMRIFSKAISLILIVSSCFAAAYAHNGEKHHWLFPNHPHLRRITKAAGIGVATGGIGGVILGSGAMAGAMTGAAVHGTYRGVKDKYDEKHHHRLK
ncbi:MAG: hypothetical protein ACRD3W_10940, partial [Terriglobales bacterium]